MDGIIALALARKAISGLVTDIKSVTVDGLDIVFTLQDDTEHRVTVPHPDDWVNMKSADIDGNGHLIITFSDDSTADAGLIPTLKGDAPTIEVAENSDESYKLTFKGEGDPITTANLKGDAPTFTVLTNDEHSYSFRAKGKNTIDTPNLHGSYFFEGTHVTGKDPHGQFANITDSKKNDVYFNTTTNDIYVRTDYDPVSKEEKQNWWLQVSNLEGDAGDDAYHTWKKIPGNEGKTIQQWIEETSASNYEIRQVWEKPDLDDEDTALNTWYLYKTGENVDPTELHNYINVSEDSYTGTIAQGTKLAMEADVGGTNYYFCVTIPMKITIDEGKLVKLQGSRDTFALCEYDQEGYSETSACETVLWYTRSLDTPPTTTLPSGYTKVTTTEVAVTDKAWLCRMSDFQLDSELKVRKFAIWNGINYYCCDSIIPFGGDDRLYYCVFDEKYQLCGLMVDAPDDEIDYVTMPMFGKLVQSATVPEGYTDISDYCTFTQLGSWVQTMYIGSDKETAKDCTINTGASYSGLVSQTTFDSVIGTGELNTDTKDVKGAINELNDKIAGNSNVTGSIIPFAGEVVPTGYLLCDGASLAKAEYAKLYNVIGTTYGSVDEDHFNIPDLRDKFVQGSGTDHEFGTTYEAGLPLPTIKSDGSHTHYWNGFYGLGSTNDKYCRSRFQLSGDPTEAMTRNDGSHTHTFKEDSIYKSTNTTVQPPSVAMVYIICTGKAMDEEQKETMVLNDLSNVNVPSPSDKDVLTYDSASAKWIRDSLLDMIYPVGSIYTTIDGTFDPSTAFGGTWESIGAGKCLFGADGSNYDAGDTIAAGLPNIKAHIKGNYMWGSSTTQTGAMRSVKYSNTGLDGGGSNSYDLSFDASKGQYNPGTSSPVAQEDSIFGKSSTVQPPAIAVVFWKRTE